MSIEQIKLIRETENKAEEIRKKGNIDAKEMIAKANKEADSILNAAKQTAESDYAETISKAEKEAKEFYDTLIANASIECDKILAQANGNLANAVSIIVGGVVT